MLKDITLGQFFPGTSVVHRLDPRTKLILLVVYIVAGVILSAAGLYKPLVQFAGAGATVPLTGFGHALAQGTIQAVQEKGWIGAFTGGLTATAGGIAAAVFFGLIAAFCFKPKPKDF